MLRVFPDLYRLNGRQRDTLSWLERTGQIGSEVTVSHLTQGRVAAADRQGRSFILAPDGAWEIPKHR